MHGLSWRTCIAPLRMHTIRRIAAMLACASPALCVSRCAANASPRMCQGDLTLVGDRGVSLSGGQRARVALARAVYADAQVYLLDDPLAACDSRVAAALMEQALP